MSLLACRSLIPFFLLHAYPSSPRIPAQCKSLHAAYCILHKSQHTHNAKCHLYKKGCLGTWLQFIIENSEANQSKLHLSCVKLLSVALFSFSLRVSYIALHCIVRCFESHELLLVASILLQQSIATLVILQCRLIENVPNMDLYCIL